MVILSVHGKYKGKSAGTPSRRSILLINKNRPNPRDAVASRIKLEVRMHVEGFLFCANADPRGQVS